MADEKAKKLSAGDIEELAEWLREEGYLSDADGDDDAERLRRAVRRLADGLAPSGGQLSPLELMFFNMKKIALAKLADELEWDDDDEPAAFKRLPKERQASKIAWRYQRSAEDRNVIDKMLWASNCTVQPVELSAAVDDLDDVVDALEAATGLDFESDDEDIEIGKLPRPVSTQRLDDGRLAVTYARLINKAAVVDQDMKLVHPVEVVTTTLVFEEGRTHVEVRGPASEVQRTVKQATHDLNRGGLHIEHDQRPLTGDQVDEFVRLIDGKVHRAKVRPPASKGVSSVDVVASTDHTHPADVRQSEMLKKDLQDCEWTRYIVHFRMEGVDHTLSISLKSGKVTFRKSLTSEAVIRRVFGLLDKAKERKPAPQVH